MYTREMEQQFKAAATAFNAAEEHLRPLKRARSEALDTLGALLLECPRAQGTHGAALWAIANSARILELLDPFLAPRDPAAPF